MLYYDETGGFDYVLDGPEINMEQLQADWIRSQVGDKPDPLWDEKDEKIKYRDDRAWRDKRAALTMSAFLEHLKGLGYVVRDASPTFFQALR